MIDVTLVAANKMTLDNIVTLNGTALRTTDEVAQKINDLLAEAIENGFAEVGMEPAKPMVITKTKPVATTKATKQTSKPKAKKSDDFDYDKYKDIATKIGAMGKKGVYKFARPTVYAVMNGEMTQAQAKKSIAAELKAKGWA